MKKSLTKIVDVLMQKIEEQPGRVQSESSIRTWLMGQGFANRDIDAAMVMVRPKLTGASPSRNRGPGKVRQLSPYERFKLTAEARDALVRLELYELLNPDEREMILDRFDQFDGEIGMAELDYLVSWVVCSARDVEYQQTIYNVLERKGEKLH